MTRERKERTFREGDQEQNLEIQTIFQIPASLFHSCLRTAEIKLQPFPDSMEAALL